MPWIDRHVACTSPCSSVSQSSRVDFKHPGSWRERTSPWHLGPHKGPFDLHFSGFPRKTTRSGRVGRDASHIGEPRRGAASWQTLSSCDCLPSRRKLWPTSTACSFKVGRAQGRPWCWCSGSFIAENVGLLEMRSPSPSFSSRSRSF